MHGDDTLEALGIIKLPSYGAEDETSIPEPKSATELGIPVSPTGLQGSLQKILQRSLILRCQEIYLMKLGENV